MFTQNPDIRRVERVPEVSPDDIQIALRLEGKGVEVPESLRPALEKYKAENGKGTPPPPKEDEKPDPPAGNKPDPKDDDEDEDEGTPPPAKPKADADEDEGDDEEDGDAVAPPKPRRTKYMSVADHHEAKKRWKEREDQLLAENTQLKTETEKLQKSANVDTDTEFEKKLEAAAEKTGMAVEDLKEIVGVLRDGITPSKDLLDKINEIDARTKPSKEDEEKKFWDEQNKQFDAEFDTALKEDGIDPDMANHKEKIRKLAFTEGYEKKTPWEIWTRFVKPKLNKKTPPPETPGSPGGSGGGDDFSALAADPVKRSEWLKTASLEQKEKFTEYMGQATKKQIRRIR